MTHDPISEHFMIPFSFDLIDVLPLRKKTYLRALRAANRFSLDP